jgi:hypothetical protein
LDRREGEGVPKLIVSLTVISTRAGRLHLTLDSLLRQDFRDFEIRVHASRTPYLLDAGIIRVPEACQALMRGDGRLRWDVVPNVGPYRKLLPVLADTAAQGALIVTADDDTLYPADWLSSLVSAFERQRCIIAFRGHNMEHGAEGFLRYRRWMMGRITDNPSVFCLPTGKDGVLYHPSFFHPSVLDVQQACRIAPTSDDLWFKWHSAANDVPVHVMNPDYMTHSLPETANGGPSLYQEHNKGGANDAAVARLELHARATFGRTLFEIIRETGY